jgi:hypothetical protein
MQLCVFLRADGFCPKTKMNTWKVNYKCEKCHYETTKKTDYRKHLTTLKHLESMTIDKQYKCVCGNTYTKSQNLSRHKKSCTFEEKQSMHALPSELNPDVILKFMMQSQEVMMELVKSNQEVVKYAGSNHHNSTTTTTNSHNNNKFNLNFFLNETCKDAMNIQEFIENIKVTFDELMTIGDAGFVSGVTDILVKRLRDLEVEKRPIHCTDSKRETIYLKDNNAWNKDDKGKSQLKRMIEKIEYKNVAALHNWCGENPDSNINNTPMNLLRDKIYLGTLRGDDKTREKIIRHISKEVTIEKD